jgi:replicative DNA helicase
MQAARQQNGYRRERVLPHNLDAEASILGGVILRNEVLARIPTLEVDDFYDMRHKIVFAAIRNLEAACSPIDVVTVEAEVERQGKLDAIGGIAFLGDLALRVPTTDNVVAYAQIVHDKRLYRELAITADELLSRAYAEDGDPSAMLAQARGDIERLARGYSDARQHVPIITRDDALAELERLAQTPIYETPWPTLNGAIGFGGLLGTQVYTVAAGTGRGKTSWVAELAGHLAELGTPVLVASYEMRPVYFVARKAAGVIGTHSNDILRGRISLSAIRAAVPDEIVYLHKEPLSVVRIAIDRLAQRYGRTPLLIVDYLQKLADAIAATQERPDLRLATSAASNQLLEIAEHTRCAIVAVSAIGRGKGRVMSSPRKSEPYDLVEVAKESGAVEYDGGGLIVLSLSKDIDGDERVGTITLAKARFGEEMHIDARYNGRRGTWRDVGRVIETVEVTTPPAPEPSNEELRQRIILELQKRPARNRNDICDRVKGKKAVILEAVRELFASEVIANVGGGITLSERGRQLLIEGTS